MRGFQVQQHNENLHDKSFLLNPRRHSSSNRSHGRRNNLVRRDLFDVHFTGSALGKARLGAWDNTQHI